MRHHTRAILILLAAGAVVPGPAGRARAQTLPSVNRPEPASQPYRPPPDEQKLIERIRRHLAAGKDVNDPLDDAFLVKGTFLHLAARDGYVAAAELLLRHKADVHAVNQRRQTPLHLACAGRETALPGGRTVYLARRFALPVARLLLAGRADVKALDWRDRTPLHMACRCGDVELVHLLLKYGADVEAAALDDQGTLIQTPLLETAAGGMEAPAPAAAGQGHERTALLLLRTGAKTRLPVDGAPLPPLYWAAARGCRELADELIKRGADVDAGTRAFDYRTPLMAAIAANDAVMACLLLDAGANINLGDRNSIRPLDLAVDDDNAGMVDLLVRRGADKAGALKRAADDLKVQAARCLLGHGCDPDESGVHTGWRCRLTLLQKLACLHKDHKSDHAEALAEMLIARGADVNREAFTRDVGGRLVAVRPVHLALQTGNLRLAKAIARGGARLDEYAYAGLGMAAELKALLETGRSAKSATAEMSLLHYAAVNGQIETAELLLAGGADMELGRGDGDTPLSAAAWAGQEVMVQWLLKRGADPSSALPLRQRERFMLMGRWNERAERIQTSLRHHTGLPAAHEEADEDERPVVRDDAR